MLFWSLPKSFQLSMYRPARENNCGLNSAGRRVIAIESIPYDSILPAHIAIPMSANFLQSSRLARRPGHDLIESSWCGEKEPAQEHDQVFPKGPRFFHDPENSKALACSTSIKKSRGNHSTTPWFYQRPGSARSIKPRPHPQAADFTDHCQYMAFPSTRWRSNRGWGRRPSNSRRNGNSNARSR